MTSASVTETQQPNPSLVTSSSSSATYDSLLERSPSAADTEVYEEIPTDEYDNHIPTVEDIKTPAELHVTSTDNKTYQVLIRDGLYSQTLPATTTISRMDP
jgi:hypothetical protein